MEVDIIYFFTASPEVIWIFSLIGGVCVIGIVNYLKCFIKNKKIIKFLVLIVSLGVALILSPLVSPMISIIVILWFLVLAVSTITFDAFTKGLPHLVKEKLGYEDKGKENTNE